jgi:hypothetical protein
MKKTAVLVGVLSLISAAALAGCAETEVSSSLASSEGTSSQESSQSESASESSSQISGGGATEYIFEAEYCPGIEDLEGKGYSGTATGTSMILQDSNGTLGASNGYYVSFLYVPGISLDFTINSSTAVNDATFTFRITAEFMDITVSPSNYTVSVNGVSLNYDDIAIDTGTLSADTVPFEDHILTTELSLKEGANTVKLLTSNDTPMVGTMSATAPMVDCFKITTTATLTWDPMTSNIES